MCDMLFLIIFLFFFFYLGAATPGSYIFDLFSSFNLLVIISFSFCVLSRWWVKSCLFVIACCCAVQLA